MLKYSISDFLASLLYSQLFIDMINRIWQLKENQRAKINYSDIEVPRKIHVLMRDTGTLALSQTALLRDTVLLAPCLSLIQQVENSFARSVVIIM